MMTNTIIQGSKADEKTTMLYIKILLNNRKIINLEMQNIDRHDWQERSLIYLCRCFNNIKKGADYIDVIPAQHIVFWILRCLICLKNFTVIFI